jgi:hypothetical protein
MQLRLPANVSPAEPAAVVAGLLLIILSTLHVPEHLEMTADDLGTLLGAVAALAAVARAWWANRRVAP